jgi:hypothetical protein
MKIFIMNLPKKYYYNSTFFLLKRTHKERANVRFLKGQVGSNAQDRELPRNLQSSVGCSFLAYEP